MTGNPNEQTSKPPKRSKAAKGSTAEQAMDRTTDVTKYVFRAPEPAKVAAYTLILSLFAGFIINFDFQHINNNFSSEQFYDNVIIFGLLLIGVPAILSGLISTPAANIFGGNFPQRRSFLLALTSTIILFCT